MGHLRTVICALLAGLWLLAAGHCSADPLSWRGHECCHASASLKADTSHGPLNDARSFDESARFLNRRPGTQAGWGGLLTQAVFPAFGLDGLELPSSLPTFSQGVYSLANYWQFHCRTALHPRAPCSVS
jgi:hypothetical protein